MAKSELQWLMTEDLPNISYQRRLRYRTSKREVLALFRLLNKDVFGNALPIPKIEIQSHCREYWGMCTADIGVFAADRTKSNCTIILSDKWFCKQWLILTLAHEMCHQYQWDVIGHKRIKEGKAPLMSHGPTFFLFKHKLAKYGIPLKRSHRMRRWFTHQNLFRC